MNTLWTNTPYASRPASCSTVVASSTLSYWEDQRVLVNWKVALDYPAGPTNYLLGLVTHRIGFDEMRPEIATAVDWQRVANAVQVEWLIAIQWTWHPSLAAPLRALLSNPLIKAAPELYNFAWNRGRDCHLEARDVLHALRGITWQVGNETVNALRRAEPILIATDAPEFLYYRDGVGVLRKYEGAELAKRMAYSSCQPSPGIKFWRDRQTVEYWWHHLGGRRLGVWGWEYTTEASRYELANAMWHGINQPLGDMQEWV